MFDDLALFVGIVDSGSLRAAALKLGLPPATLTRRLQQLERQLGSRLLNRSARRLQLTNEGQQYYEQCRPLLRALQQATQALDATQHSVSGLVRVLAPINLAGGVFRSCLSGFLHAYPEVRLELKLSNLQEDLIGSGADLALRTGEQPDSGLHQRRLGTVRFVLVAAPAYLRTCGAPAAPHELAAHRLTVAEPMTTWRLRHRTSQATFSLAAEGRCQVNEIALAVHMARDGIGILCCPLTMCHQELQDGTLQEVLPEWQAEARGVYAVWPQQRYLPARVRALLDHLQRFAQGEPLLNPP